MDIDALIVAVGDGVSVGRCTGALYTLCVVLLFVFTLLSRFQVALR